MNKAAIFNFTIQKEAKSITVERSFNAPLDLVWAAWTDPAILCQWWAPKPYQCVIKSLDFREGGRWSYCMQGPNGERHYGVFDYLTVRPKTFYSGKPAFCDEHEVINPSLPRSTWECSFNKSNGTTIVQVRINYETQESMETILQMGFKEGFTLGLEQLDELFTYTTYYHGTKAALQLGDLIEPGYNSNYGQRNQAKYVYLTATLDAATWGAELAQGEGRGRIFIVEPTGHFENDPNLTDKKFPGNPTRSYRTKSALRVVGEVSDWQGHAPEQLQSMKDHLQRLKEQGIEAIED